MLQQLIDFKKQQFENKNRDYIRGFECIQDFFDDSLFYLHVLPNTIEELEEYKSHIQETILKEESQGQVKILLARVTDYEAEYFYQESDALNYIKTKLKEVINEESDKEYFDSDISVLSITIFITELSDYFSGNKLEKAKLYFNLNNF